MHEKAWGSGEELKAEAEKSLEEKLFLPFCSVPEFATHRKASLLPLDALSPRNLGFLVSLESLRRARFLFVSFIYVLGHLPIHFPPS